MQPTLLLLWKTQLQDGNWQIIAKRAPPSGRPAGKREREKACDLIGSIVRLVLLLHRSKCLLRNISIIPVVFGSEQHCVSIYSNTSFLLLMQLLHSVRVLCQNVPPVSEREQRALVTAALGLSASFCSGFDVKKEDDNRCVQQYVEAFGGERNPI